MATRRSRGKTLKRLTFLIHGLCYSEMEYKDVATGHRLGRALSLHLEREIRCKQRWRQRISSFAPDEALCIMPWRHYDSHGPCAAFEQWACSLLKDRCFILDAADSRKVEYWNGSKTQIQDDIYEDLRDAFLHQGESWNKEELVTSLLARACIHQFKTQLRQRSLNISPSSVRTEAWGASFEGCVTKFSLWFRRLLGLPKPIDIAFDMTVPDDILLPATFVETLALDDKVRFFLFQVRDRWIAFCTATSISLADPPCYLSLAFDPKTVSVISKQGIPLWPKPQSYHLPGVEVGVYEPPQKLVYLNNGRLHLPLSSGYVYRLSKAPAYLCSAPRMPWKTFRKTLLRSKLN